MDLILRSAGSADEKWVYDLARERHTDLSVESHREWWRLHQGESLVAHSDGPAVGHVRIDADNEVHITVASTARGQGIGTAMLRRVRRPGLWARVHDSNEASQRAFARAGWHFAGDLDGFQLWRSS